MKYLIILGALLWLLLSWFASSVGLKAEEITTGNLLTNGNFETGNTNGWQTTGDVQVLNDCCTLNNVASNYDLEFGDSGSITQDVNLTTESITQDMLNNGITLSQVTEVQNGECAVSGCWGGQGGADSFTITLQIKDSNGNVIASMNSTRTDTTGIAGANFTDTLIYTGSGSNVGNTNISAIDANAPATLGGPNIDNISLSMTFDNTVLQDDTREDLREFEEHKVELPQEPTFVPEVISAPPPKEEKFEEVAAPIETFKKEPKEPKPPMVASAATPKEEPKEEKPETLAKSIIEETKKEKTNVRKEEASKSETETKAESETEEKVASKEEVKKETKKENTKVATLEASMDKVDAVVKDAAKNLEVKSIIKLNAMKSDISLAAYNNQEFYKSKDIYLNQVVMFDNRKIYNNASLANYIGNDPINIKENKLYKINLEKQRLLIEIRELNNG